MNLSALLEGIKVKEIIGNPQLAVTGISFDSRAVQPGNLFVCISGFESDGHEFAPMAIEKGAAVIVAEKDLRELGVTCIVVENSRAALATLAANYYGHPDRKFCLMGITGTNGKTTVTYLIKSVLEAMGKKVGLIGTRT